MSNPQWSPEQISDHVTAGELLSKTKEDVFTYLASHPTCTEFEVLQVVFACYKTYGLVVDSGDAIVAFNESAAAPHYFPKASSSKKLTPDTVVLLDIWARLKKKNAPYADVTFMGFYGSHFSSEIQMAYQAVTQSRNAAITYLEQALRQSRIPTGKEVDDASRDFLIASGYKAALKHHTGHSIGFSSPHGRWRHVNHLNHTALVPNLGYTIEPGLYFNNKFGFRSEVDFYITEDLKLVVSTEVQTDFPSIVPK